MLWLLLLTLGVVVDARAQGLLNLLTRRYVPSTEQARVNVPLHYLYPWLYVLLLVSVGLEYRDGLVWHVDRWVIAALLRIALFDPVLNWSKGDPVFAVGSSALVDKLLRRLTPASEGRVASAFLRVAAAAGVVAFLIFLL
ncbi:hypothetical protein [Hymenobacter guriensis]|uniref:Uncharacterized protein n=1 Tax=Hymenobacter guriensis TaxID=2793065 RepID=A0ABS0KWZ2_9BACT|nr:hypothetical protein [Hymenobacter guriensis]MBG8552371.1 hypothetical protein [Hymenobacter guriensis]